MHPMIRAFCLFAAAFVLTTTAAAAADGYKLGELRVAASLTAGQPYDVSFTYEKTGDPSLRRVCFLWSGEGPYCWDNFRVNSLGKTIQTRARTRTPGSYTLMGYVEYSVGGEVVQSNKVSATIEVR